MDPQSSTPDSSSFPDILPRLPKELFVLALDTLPLVDILNATAINKDYRDRIYSSPQLFSTIDEAIYPEEVEGVSHPERANRATFKLIKCASLSNNRLKNVSLNLIPFEVDFFRADLSHWLSTSTYLLLQILRLNSSESLQRLSLKFRSSEPPWIGSRQNLTKVITLILKELHSFNKLTRIEIEGRSYLSILSSSSTSKTNQSNPPKVLSIKSTVDRAGEIDSEWVHPDWDILREVQRFTGGGILEFKCHHSSNVPRKRIEDQVLQELRKSQKCLEILEIKDVMIRSPHDWLEFAMACPKLWKFGFNLTIPEGESWIKSFNIPVSSPKILELDLTMDPTGTLPTYPILQVFASNVKVLQVSGETDPVDTNWVQLFRLLQISRSTLEELKLFNLSLDIEVRTPRFEYSTNFKFLRRLELIKIETAVCNVFLWMDWDDWTSLTDISIQALPNEYDLFLDSTQLVKRLCSVRKTLRTVIVLDDDDNLEETPERVKLDRKADGICFPVLAVLQLNLWEDKRQGVKDLLLSGFPSLSQATLSRNLSQIYSELVSGAP